MKASDLIVACLENEGVKYIFGLPGEENEDLLFSLENSSIKFIPTRHEQGAAFMADVYGRLTGKAGVCLSTLGPGATNLITGIADAHLDKSPLVAITGQGDSHRLHKESHQLLDIVSMFKPITKWNTTINAPKIIPEVVRKAFKLAEMEKPGATHFELPENIAKLDVSAEHAIPIPAQRVRRSAPDYKAIQDALALLKQAKKPLILAGNGAIRKLASKHLREFVQQTRIPVISTFMGKGAVSDREPYSLFSVGLKGDYSRIVFEHADLIISIGYDVAEHGPESWNPKKDKTIIHIDFTPAEVYEYYQPAIEIVCDISATLWELNQMTKKEQLIFDDQWYLPLREHRKKDIESYTLEEHAPFTVAGTLNLLRELMHDDDILISDVGAHKMWIARNFMTYEPNTCIISNGLASMGIAVPGGFAAKLACPDKRVVVGVGDGGFLMSAYEIETAKRIGVAYTILIFNDNNYGLITAKQRLRAGRIFGTELTNPDFKRYAESFGIRGYAPQTLSELKQNLKEALESNVLCIMEIGIDPAENLKLSKKLGHQNHRE